MAGGFFFGGIGTGLADFTAFWDSNRPPHVGDTIAVDNDTMPKLHKNGFNETQVLPSRNPLFGGDVHRFVYTEIHMGVPVRATLFSTETHPVEQAAREIFRTLATLEDIFSDWRPTSEANRLCAHPGDWVTVSQPLWDVLNRCGQVFRASGGVFDPTIGPLVRLWRESRRTKRLPHPSLVQEARRLVGWERVELRESKHQVRVGRGTQLDFGGIAKGYALSQAALAVPKQSLSGFLIEAGGDIAAFGSPKGRKTWRIALPSGQRVDLQDTYVSTSGDDFQFVEIEGRRYAHIVDPRTGLGAVDIRRSTIIGDDAAVVDACATAACLMSAEDTRRMIGEFAGLRFHGSSTSGRHVFGSQLSISNAPWKRKVLN